MFRDRFKKKIDVKLFLLHSGHILFHLFVCIDEPLKQEGNYTFERIICLSEYV